MTLKFKSANDLLQFLNTAKTLDYNTPYDFRIIGNTVQVLNRDYKLNRMKLLAAMANVKVMVR